MNALLQSIGFADDHTHGRTNVASRMETASHVAGTPLFPILQPFAYSIWQEWAKGLLPDELPEPETATRMLRCCEKICRGPFMDKKSEAIALHMHCQTLLVINALVFEPLPDLDFIAIAKHQNAQSLPPVVLRVVDIAEKGLCLLRESQLEDSDDGKAFKSGLFRALFRHCCHPHSSVRLFDRALELGALLVSPQYTGPDLLKRQIRRKCAELFWGRSTRQVATAIEDLTKAIALATSETDDERLAQCSKLGVYYAERATRRGRCEGAREDIVKAVELTREALRNVTDREQRLYCQWNLGRRLLSLHEYTGRSQDLDDAIDLFEQSQDTEIVKAEYRRGYFMALAEKGRLTKKASLEEQAAVGLEDLLRTIPENEPHKKVRITTDLASKEHILNRRDKDMYTMDRLYPLLPTEMKDKLRFATYDEDLDQISLWNLEHEGVASMTSPLSKSSVGKELTEEFKSSSTASFSEPRRSQTRAYASSLWALAGSGGRERSQRLRMLGTNQAASKKYRLAEFLFRKAVQGTENDHNNHAQCLATIAEYYSTRLGDLPVPKDIPQSLLVYNVPVGRQRFVLACLARLHLTLSAAFASLRLADYEPASARLRAYHGQRAGDIFTTLNIWHHASLAYFSASASLRSSLNAAATLSDLVIVAKQRVNTSSKGCFAALKNGAPPSEILVYAEASRALVLSTLMIDLPDLSHLESELPDKFREYQNVQNHLRIAIDDVERSNVSKTDGGKHSEDILDAWKQLRDLEARIRKHENFDRFQLPATPDELCLLAGTGAIVSFNVTNEGTHAFTVTKEFGIRVIELPQFRFEALVGYALDSAGASRLSLLPMEKRPQANKDMSKLLRWVWESIVDPVLDHLGYKQQHTVQVPGDLPRIHWVSAGIMGSLPLHAAGIYTKAGHPKQRTPMYALSSYTPSIKALAASRRKKMEPLISLKDKMMVVGMQTTPGLSDLPQVRNEIAGIVRAFCDEADDARKPVITFQHLISDVNWMLDPTPEKVLTGLPTTDAVHFACHGISNPKDPASSALIIGKHEIYEGCTIPLVLTVEQMSRLDLTKARLAYLSACVTATTADYKAFDEALHIASILQTMGFSHVIGTMWEVEDTVSASMAGKFYTRLRTLLAPSAVGSDNHKAVAVALREASEEIRQESPASYLDWVPYVHYGA
jgi:tetratricopeptide (TPR) repeat protein